VVDDEKSRSCQGYVDTMVDVEAHDELGVDQLDDELMQLVRGRWCVTGGELIHLGPYTHARTHAWVLDS
jgi:hypothetical protein